MQINVTQPMTPFYSGVVLAGANLKESEYRSNKNTIIEKSTDVIQVIDNEVLNSLSVFTVNTIDLYKAAERYDVLSSARFNKPVYDLTVEVYVDKFEPYCKIFITTGDTTIIMVEPEDSIFGILSRSGVDLNDPDLVDTLANIAKSLSSLF